MRRRLYNQQVEYIYTILSNCEGGGVYVNDNQVGTIQNGRFIYKTKSEKLSRLYVSGGVPEEHTEIGSEYTTTDTDDYINDDVINAISTFAASQSQSWAVLLKCYSFDKSKAYVTRTTTTVKAEETTTAYFNDLAKYNVSPGTYTFNYKENIYTRDVIIDQHQSLDYPSINNISYQVRDIFVDSDAFRGLANPGTNQLHPSSTEQLGTIYQQGNHSGQVAYHVTLLLSVQKYDGSGIMKEIRVSNSIVSS